MPMPRWVARANRVGFNRVFNFIAPWAPGFGVLTHRGRKSGKVFRTPLVVFRQPDGYLIALTYGPGADWVKNVIASGSCRLVTRRRTYELRAPRLYRDENLTEMPSVVRFILRRAKVDEFLALQTAGAANTK